MCADSRIRPASTKSKRYAYVVSCHECADFDTERSTRASASLL
ncbi:MAG: hypothetical protein ACK56F_26220 [bacterium]